MTDGPTAIQVSPITEDEMNKVHDILSRAINAIVGMSQLSKDVESLQAQVAQLTDDSSRLRRTNDALEESLSNSRRNRQDMEAQLIDAQHATVQATGERDSFKNEAEVAKANLERRTQTLEITTRDRDDAQMVATIGFKYVKKIDDHVPDPTTCRVLDVATLAEGDIRFGWNSWRGDHYGYTLAPIVQEWSDRRHERLMAEIEAGRTPKPEVFILGEEQQ